MQKVIPVMNPSPGERLQRFVGDRVHFTLKTAHRHRVAGWRALLRTNLGRAESLRREILRAHTEAVPSAGEAWRDVPMKPTPEGWTLDLALAEAGYFRAKAYLVDPEGIQHWAEGPDVGISVHPDQYRTGNTLYCAFPRLFGPTRTATDGENPELEKTLTALETAGYAVLPPSGKLRDVTQALPHIVKGLGCRILHLLPIHPTPTTYGRFGRFGSPYAALDLTAIDPALVVLDRKTTGIDQFQELSYETHRLGAKLFLDIVINHTGWGSVLQENHPEWFLKNAEGSFASPGAWGTTWEDLVELRHVNVALWDNLAEMFLTWCRRGVDGFRCDAGYMVPVAAWQYLIARVQQEHPETIFFLEGLGGAWQATESLLAEGGMQWAYSELFQNYSGPQVAGYLDHSIKQTGRAGVLVHYSETHDNQRLAAKSRNWSLLRNQLCALTSFSGGFGFTCGVEWLAAEKIKVHGSTGLAWGQEPNLVGELSALNRLLAEHPCFFDGATLTRLSAFESQVLALRRDAPAAAMPEGVPPDSVLVLANLDPERSGEIELAGAVYESMGRPKVDLLDPADPAKTIFRVTIDEGRTQVRFKLPPGKVLCLARAEKPAGLTGTEYRSRRAIAGWALQTASQVLPPEALTGADPATLGHAARQNPTAYLGALSALRGAWNVEPGAPIRSLPDLMNQRIKELAYNAVVRWSLLDSLRITPVPPDHWLLVEDQVPFRACLETGGTAIYLQSLEVGGNHLVCFPPQRHAGEALLTLERYGETNAQVRGTVVFLGPGAGADTPILPGPEDVVLLTNGRGGMARLAVNLGSVRSKYDCVLGANLHPTLPVDRHILAKRLRVWVNADGFLSQLDYRCLRRFEAGPHARWWFVANAGDGRTVEIEISAAMLAEQNTTAFFFHRPNEAQAKGKQLPPDADVRLTVRVDIEDRGFHSETHRNGGADHHFASHTRPLAPAEVPQRKPELAPSPQCPADGKEARTATHWAGFEFTPAPDRKLRIFSNAGRYHPQPEWSENIPHPVEQSRGQVAAGDAYSPGWFELPLRKGGDFWLAVTAEPENFSLDELEQAAPVSPSPSSLQSVRSLGLVWPATRPCSQGIRGAPRGRQDGHRRLSLVFGLGARHVHLRARPAGGGHGGGGPSNGPDLCALRGPRNVAEHDFRRRCIEPGHVGCASVVCDGLRRIGRGRSGASGTRCQRGATAPFARFSPASPHITREELRTAFAWTRPAAWCGVRAISPGWTPITRPAHREKAIRWKSRPCGCGCCGNSSAWAFGNPAWTGALCQLRCCILLKLSSGCPSEAGSPMCFRRTGESQLRRPGRMMRCGAIACFW